MGQVKIKGGKGDNESLEDLAKKFKVSIKSFQNQLDMGIEVEHTKDKQLAKDIAMDHLSEMPDYYTRLEDMENKALKNGI